jgi:hypothetical protein
MAVELWTDLPTELLLSRRIPWLRKMHGESKAVTRWKDYCRRSAPLAKPVGTTGLRG